MRYRTVTAQDLLLFLATVIKDYGNVPVYSGDFEGNYLHGKHGLCYCPDTKAVCLQYEMYETIEDI